MSMKADSKTSRKLELRLVRCIVESLVEQGDIDPRNKTTEELFQELRNFAANNKVEWTSITDHTPDWLKKARKAHKNEDFAFAVIAYATWLEHQINRFVDSFGKRQSVPVKLVESLIRHTGTAEKFIWLHLALGCKPPTEMRLNRIRRLLEARNQYVHYKWKPDAENEDELLKAVIKNAEKVVEELRVFYNRHFFHGQKKQIAALFNFQSKNN
jgi:hypothetical protein